MALSMADCEQWAGQLTGTWIYGKDSAPSRYCIEESSEHLGKLKVRERLPTGVWVSGELAPQDEWLTTTLCTPEGKRIGVMRLRYVEEDNTIRSNVRGPSTSVWGKDIVAHRHPDEVHKNKKPAVDNALGAQVKQPRPREVSVKGGSTADVLSKFFDTIEARILASERPAQEKEKRLQPKGYRQRAEARRLAQMPPAPLAAVAAADTAIVKALATTDPLGQFGYSMNRLKAAGGSMQCAETTPAGAPLLAIPLSACWTAEAVQKECPQLAGTIAAAASRNSKSTMLKADTTWIALHILHEKRAGSAALTHRKAHLALMPDSPEGLLAWTARDFQALHGSRWQEVAKQRRDQLASDFAVLTSELGPATTKSLGLELDGYVWARQVIQQLGLHFMGADGLPLQAVVPGLELLEPDTELPPNAEGARLEFAGGDAGSVVVYAAKDFAVGSTVTLSHAGLASSSGFWLLSGQVQTLETNPCEFAEVMLRFPLGHDDVKPTGWFWETVDGLEEALAARRSTRPGDCLPPHVAEAQPLVEMAYRRGQPELRVHLRLTKNDLLPGRMALWRLGLVILAHNERVDKVLKQEQTVLNPLGVDACERRALAWLQKRLDWLLQEGPARPEEDAAKLLQGHSGDVLPRRVRGLRLVVAERRILSEALDAINERLAVPAAPAARVEVPAAKGEGVLGRLFDLFAGEEPEEGSDLGCAVAQLRGCTQALEQITERFKGLISGKRFAEGDGKSLKEEFVVIQRVLAGSPLKPTTAKSGQAHFTTDAVIKVCAETNKAALLAELVQLEWTVAATEKAGQKEKTSEALLSSANVKSKLADFQAAHSDLKKYLSLVPAATEEAMKFAQTCALHSLVRSEKVLSGSWKGCGVVLTALREKMRTSGYMKAGAQLPWPTRVPPESDVAEGYQAMWKEGSKMATESRKTRSKVPSTTWWVMREAKKDLRGLLRLFILREPVGIAEALDLLGADACKLLLERSALCCYSSKDGSLLTPEEAVKATTGPSAGGPEILATVGLWPVEEDVVVAVDYEHDFYQDGGFEPVTYLGEDSKCLLSAASRQPVAKSVLDICCGSGAQGIAALKRSADKATFLDGNPRALRFAAFGAALSGVEDKATFVEASFVQDGLPASVQGPFDAIFAGLPFLPNPDNALVNSGPAFKSGGFDGEIALSAVLSKAPKLLSPGGSLTLTSMVPNVDGIAERIKGWVGMSSGCQAAVFRGKAISTDEFAGRATAGCPETQAIAYFRGLEQEVKVQSMSEAMVLLWAPPKAGALGPTKVDIRAEQSGLWTDEAYVWRELERLLLAMGVATAEEPLYTIDWAAGQEAEAGEDRLSPTPQTASSTTSVYAPKVSKEQQKEFSNVKGMEGATWNDIVQVNGPGFSPPVLCDLLWSKVGGLLKADKKAIPHVYSNKTRAFPFQWGMLEFQADVTTPEPLVEALKGVGCTDRISFQAGAFSVQKDYLRRLGGPKREVKVSNYDILIVPIIAKGIRATTPVVETPSVLLAFFKAAMKQLKKRSKPARIVLLTCGCFGPGYVEGVIEQVPAAAPALGLVRTMRREVPQVPIIWVDTDEMSSFGSHSELMSQITFELDVATPKGGMWGVTTQERALMLLSNNRDVAYRNGQRYLPKLDLSPRMPIYVGCEVPPLPRAAAEGVILITGGVGGVGLVAAEALVEAGAQCLVLSSKSGDVPKGVGVERRIQAMQEQDVTVIVEKCDTSKDRDVQKLLERIRSNFGPLTAVVHSAGLLADAALDKQDSGMMTHVFEPKAQGAFYLHKHSLEDNLANFMMFSSVAALRGSVNQANYAAACSYLDELARLRVAQGLPAVSVQWPGVDLSGRTVKDDSCVGLGTVKQVIKQLMCGREPIQPVQAVLPQAYLEPSSPPVRSLLEPLLARASPGAAAPLGDSQAERPQGTQGAAPKAPRVNWG